MDIFLPLLNKLNFVKVLSFFGSRFVEYNSGKGNKLFTPFGNALIEGKTNKGTDPPVFLINWTTEIINVL